MIKKPYEEKTSLSSKKEQILDCLKNLDWRVSLENPNVLLSKFPEEYEKILGDLVFHDRFFAVGSRIGSPEIRWLSNNSIYLRAYRSSNEITIEEVLDDFKKLVKDLGLKINYSEYEKAVKLAESSLKKVRELYGENEGENV